MSAPNFEFPTTAEALDVVEAGEMFEFIADWLAAAGPAVGADLARHLDPAVYPLSAMIADCGRLAAAFGYQEERR